MGNWIEWMEKEIGIIKIEKAEKERFSLSLSFPRLSPKTHVLLCAVCTLTRPSFINQIWINCAKRTQSETEQRPWERNAIDLGGKGDGIVFRISRKSIDFLMSWVILLRDARNLLRKCNAKPFFFSFFLFYHEPSFLLHRSPLVPLNSVARTFHDCLFELVLLTLI